MPKGKSQRIGEAYEGAFSFASNILTWSLLKVFNPGHTWGDVLSQQCDPPDEEEQAPEQKDSCESGVKRFQSSLGFEFASKMFEREERRSEVIDGKNRVLLTIAAFSLALIAALAPQMAFKWLAVLSALPVLASIYLTLVHFSVQEIPTPQWRLVEDCSDESESKKIMANELDKQSDAYSIKNDYRVGVFRASIRAITLGIFLILVCLGSWFIFPVKEPGHLETIKQNHELFQLLRGERGAEGPRGMQGEKGAVGPQGIPGESASSSGCIFQLFHAQDDNEQEGD